jgi:protein-disulfide isomerase
MPTIRRGRLAMTRDAETETLLRTYTNPLFRAADLVMALSRSMHLRDAALNLFTNTGNPVFIGIDAPPGGQGGGGREPRGFPMRRMISCRVLGLLAALLVGLAAMPAMAEGFTARQRAEIVEVVRAALKADPSILRDAIGALQDDDASAQQAAARAAIPELADALTRAPGDPVDGNPQGDVTVVEFFDARCPYCRRMLPVMADLLARDRNLRVVYKDIPILGPGSVLAAKALLAAQQQGGYLKLKNAVMTGPAEITPDSLRAATAKTGLDWDRLQKDMADPAVQQRLEANLGLAHKLGISGTPAYVIGGQMLPGALGLAELQEAAAAARKR